jgi:phosphatidylinositol kinase/protein kinase (PI-3  family)
VSLISFVALAAARANFVASLAGYSLVCYILQIKDRHNGNILIDRDGHIIHIDFDFFISNSPGGNMHFEKAPFKLTSEYIDVLDGATSETFQYFKELMRKGFLALQKEHKRITVLIEMMLSVNKKLPCFFEKGKIITDLSCRLFPTINGQRRKTGHVLKEAEGKQFIDQ